MSKETHMAYVPCTHEFNTRTDAHAQRCKDTDTDTDRQTDTYTGTDTDTDTDTDQIVDGHINTPRDTE